VAAPVSTLAQADEVLIDKVTPVLEQYDALRVIYGDILRGFSIYNPTRPLTLLDTNSKDESKKIYIKHFDDQDNIEIARKKEGLMRRFQEEGVPSEKERAKIVREAGEWSEDDDDEITSLELSIADNAQNLKLLSSPAQQQKVRSILETMKVKLADKINQKHNILGVTAENRASKITNNYFVYYAFYKDEDLKEKMWTEVEFQEMDEVELVKNIKIYNKTLKNFTERAFRKIAALPFVLNFASYCKDQGMFFYGKPITRFTNYQMAIYTKAMRNTFVLRESKIDPPEINQALMMQQLLDYYDEQYSLVTAPIDNSKAGQIQESNSKRGQKRSIQF